MADPMPVEPVKLFVAVLFPAAVADDDPRWRDLLKRMQSIWGDVDFCGQRNAFNITDYYEPEMGAHLARRLVAFAELFPPDGIAAAKLCCNDLEREFAKHVTVSSEVILPAEVSLPAGRTFNLDVGYLDHSKIVLASLKPAGQKIYLRDGVYADPIARYENGRYMPFPWTFPDFRDGRFDAELTELRATHLRQLRGWRTAAES